MWLMCLGVNRRGLSHCCVHVTLINIQKQIMSDGTFKFLQCSIFMVFIRLRLSNSLLFFFEILYSIFYLLILDWVILFFSDNLSHGRENHMPMVAVIECPNVQLVKLGIRALDNFPCLSVPYNARDSQYQVKMFWNKWSFSSMSVFRSLSYLIYLILAFLDSWMATSCC